MERMSVAQLQRNLHRLNDFDIIELVDKKRDEIKGYILHRRYKPLIDSLTSKPSYSLAGALKKYANEKLIDEEKEIVRRVKR
jgi:hypothetical protein